MKGNASLFVLFLNWNGWNACKNKRSITSPPPTTAHASEVFILLWKKSRKKDQR